MYFGVCVTILVTTSWVGATHCIKYMYLYRAPYEDELDDDLDTSSSRAELSTELEDILAISDSSLHHVEDATEMFNIPPRQPVYFNAPFFAAWFFTNFSLLFFPIYILGLVSARKCDKLSEILADVLRGFRERGFTIGKCESFDMAELPTHRLLLLWLACRSLPQSLPLVLHPVAGYHLSVYAVAARALRHGCTGSVCHQCCLRLSALLGDTARAVRRRQGELEHSSHTPLSICICKLWFFYCRLWPSYCATPALRCSPTWTASRRAARWAALCWPRWQLPAMPCSE